MAKTYTMVVDGVTVTFEVDKPGDGSIVVTFKKPDAIDDTGGQAPLNSNTHITSGPDDQNCVYRIEPSGTLTWGQVNSDADVSLNRICE